MIINTILLKFYDRINGNTEFALNYPLIIILVYDY